MHSIYGYLRSWLLVPIALLMLAPSATIRAQPSGSTPGQPGRYQAIPLTKPNESSNSVLIIDTETGDVWKYFEGLAPGPGSGIRYEGAAVPGDKPGETVARQGFDLPAIQRPSNRR
jgi:hypothetical protein